MLFIRRHRPRQHGDCVHLIQYVLYQNILNDGDMSAAATRPMTQVDDQQKEVGEWDKVLVES